ncbi:MAG TPA: methyltransferase domain-containing protein [Candidatus Limnocylindria bacterium]|nr:methyltransferase domain-containing protein [Candidatus Limnocylindria bacterium]
MTVDLDGVLAEVRERIQQKRASGTYGPDVDAALHAPLPGGPALLVDDLQDPLGSLAGVLATPVEYDHRSRKRYVGRAITAARGVVIGLVRWWINAITDRQERINRLVAAGLQELAARPAPEFGARLDRIERLLETRARDEVAQNLHSVYFQARFSGDEPVIRAQSERFLPLFRGRRRVLDLGSGRGTFLELARENGIGAYGVDLDERMVAEARSRGLEAVQSDALAPLRSLDDNTIDGLYARHVAEHVLPGELVEILRELRRVLAPGSPLVMITPNVATLTVGAHSFWLDPSHRRPLPPELFRFYLEVEGFSMVAIETFERSELRLSEDVPEGGQLDNVRLLNETLFGHRDYAVIGRQPGQPEY